MNIGSDSRGWPTVQLGQLVDVLDGQRVPVNKTEREKRPGNVPYYGATGQVGWIDKALFNEDLLLLGEDGVQFLDAKKTKAYLISGPSWVNNHAHVLRAREATSNRFLLHYLNHVDYHGFVSGTTRLKLNQAAMRRIPVTLPNPKTQREIVEEIEKQFTRLDAGVASLRRALPNLKRYRSAVVSTELEVDAPWTTLGETGSIVGGITKDSKRQSDPGYVEVPYLRVANVQRGYLDLKEITTIRVPPEKAITLRLQPGDVLFNEGGDRDKLGRGWIWEGQIEDCIHQNHVFRARLSPEFNPKFISYHGNSYGLSWFLREGKQTTNLASLNLTTLKSFPVPAPPREVQDRIVSEIERQLSMVDALSEQVQKELKRAEGLRQSILSSAFSGKLITDQIGRTAGVSV